MLRLNVLTEGFLTYKAAWSGFKYLRRSGYGRRVHDN